MKLERFDAILSLHGTQDVSDDRRFYVQTGADRLLHKLKLIQHR